LQLRETFFRSSPQSSGLGRPVPSPCLLPDGLSWVDLRRVFSLVVLGWVDLRQVFSPGGWVGSICGDAPDLLPISGWVDLENAPLRRVEHDTCQSSGKLSWGGTQRPMGADHVDMSLGS
jgi:hypothetical protein